MSLSVYICDILMASEVILMKMQYACIEEIAFTYMSYPESLYESISRIGLSFAIKVSVIDNQYQCVDGHKRLSALSDLKKQGIVKKVTIIVVNDGSTRSNDCWRARNTH